MNSPVEEQLRALEVEAERAEPGAAAQLLNRAGDICLAAGDKDRALAYYGRGIDANLYGRRYDAAVGLCHKLLRVSPAAVRTRCTLAWLAVGRGELAETVRELGEYVSAAVAAGEQPRATRHLALMAEVTDDGRVRELIAAHLDRLGKPDAARHVIDSIVAAASPRRTTEDAREARWTKVIFGALAGPNEL